jgi:hypothetical protein
MSGRIIPYPVSPVNPDRSPYLLARFELRPVVLSRGNWLNSNLT